MRFPNLFLCDIIAPWSSQAILFTFLFHEGDLKSSAGRVWVTRPALFVFTCLPVRPASRRRSVPVSHPYRRRCARPSRYAHQRSDRARTAARRRPTLRRKIRDTLSCVSYSLQRTVKIDIFVFGVKGSTAYKTGPSYWMPVSCAGLIFSSGKSFRHHTLSLSIKYETTSTYCFKRDLRNMRFPAR